MFLLLILLLKANLLRLKGGLIGGLFALLLISGIFASTSVAIGSLIYAYNIKKNNNNVADSIEELENIRA